MVTTLIILVFLTVFFIGFVQVYNRHLIVEKEINFAEEYRCKFVEFSSKYFQTYERFGRSGDFDSELYVWLTKNSSKIQNYVGTFGLMTYQPAFQNYMLNNYQIITNTLPEFSRGQVQNSDVGAVDDCLLRYIGYMEGYRSDTLKNMRNPIVWFREGFRVILSVPILILNWFGIINSRKVNSIKDRLIYKLVAGLISLVTLISGLVTIIVGYNHTLEFVYRIFGR